jgi:hypothetical protein
VVAYVRLVATAVAGFGPALGLWLGLPWNLVAFSVIGLALAIGWPALTDVPARHSARGVLTGVAALAISLAAVWDGDDAPALAVAFGLGLGLPACVVRELAREAPRAHLVRSLAGTASGVGLVSLLGLWAGSDDVATPLRNLLADGPGAAMDSVTALALAAGFGITGAVIVLGVARVLPAFPHVIELAALAAVAVAAGAGLGAAWAWGGIGLGWGAAVGGVAGLAPTGLWVIGWHTTALTGRPRLRDLAIVMVPAAVAAAPVWVAAILR